MDESRGSFHQVARRAGKGQKGYPGPQATLGGKKEKTAEEEKDKAIYGIIRSLLDLTPSELAEVEDMIVSLKCRRLPLFVIEGK